MGKPFQSLFVLSLLFWLPLQAQDNETQGNYSPIVRSIFGEAKVTYQQIPDSALYSIVLRAVEESSRSFRLDQRQMDGVIDSLQKTIASQSRTIENLSSLPSNAQVLDRIDQLATTYNNLKEEFEARGDNDALAKKAEELVDAGKFEEAEQILEQDVHRDNKKVAYKNYLLAETKTLSLKYAEATPYYQAAAALPPVQFKYLNAFGNNLQSLGRATEARAAYESALKIAKLPKEKESTLFNNLGLAWFDQGEYDRAIEFYEKSLAIDTIVFGLQHPKVATDFNNLGSAWKAKGEYDRAIVFFEKAIAIDTLSVPQRNPILAISYNNLGIAWEAKGEYDKAIKFIEKALSIDSIVWGLNHPSVATNYNNLGIIWDSKGEYDKAIQYFNKSVEINTRAFGQEHPRIASTYNNLGSAWSGKKNSDLAINFYEKALKIDSIFFGLEHPKVATRYNNLGLEWSNKGEFERAISLLEKSLSIDTNFFGLKHPRVATNYNSLGYIWKAKGEYDKAIFFIEKSLAIDTLVFGVRHPRVATDFSNLGFAWSDKEEHKTAINYLDKALNIFTYFFTNDHFNIILLRKNLAELHNSLGMSFYQYAKFDSALIHFKSALAYANQVESSKFSLTCLNNLAGAYRNLNRFEEALDHSNQGLSLGQQLYDQTLIALDTLPSEWKQHPNFEAYKQRQLNTFVIHRLKLHKACSLKGLGRTEEQESLVEELQSYAIKHNDERMLADLKKEFGEQ